MRLLIVTGKMGATIEHKIMKLKESTAAARKQQDTIREMSQDINNTLMAAKNVRPEFMTHAVNMANGEHGIAFLIASILENRMAKFFANVADTEHRGTAIKAAMFASEIIAEVDDQFSLGTSRYMGNTVPCYLCSFLSPGNKHQIKNTMSGKPLPRIGKIQLTNNEDRPRPTKRPRIKYFLIES